MFSWRSPISEPIAPNPAADAFAAAIRPGEIAAPLATPAQSGARSLGWLFASGAFHGAALAATLMFAVAGRSDPSAEIPVEIVLEAPAPVEPPPAGLPPVAQEPPALVAVPPPPPAAQAAAAEPPPIPQPPPVAALAPPEDRTAAPAHVEDMRRQAARDREPERPQDRAQERPQERPQERVQERAEARAQARAQARAVEARRQEQRRREQARREAAAQERDAERPAPVRLAARAPVGAAGVRDDFDAGAYRAIVARAVAAAVGSTCPGAGAGRVVVALSIGATGRVAGAALTRASGNGALDAAALSAVRRAGPFPAPSGRSGVNVPVAVSCR